MDATHSAAQQMVEQLFTQHTMQAGLTAARCMAEGGDAFWCEVEVHLTARWEDFCQGHFRSP